jgi:hypothetical protein
MIVCNVVIFRYVREQAMKMYCTVRIDLTVRLFRNLMLEWHHDDIAAPPLALSIAYHTSDLGSRQLASNLISASLSCSTLFIPSYIYLVHPINFAEETFEKKLYSARLKSIIMGSSEDKLWVSVNHGH